MKSRNSNIELLRIITMVLIVLNHIPISPSASSANNAWRNLFYCGGKFGVDVFVIIGSYYLSDSSFKMERIKRIIIDVFFYSTVCCLVVLFFGNGICSIGEIIRSYYYWYPLGYIFMLIASVLIKKLPRYIHLVIVVAGGVIAFATMLPFENTILEVLRSIFAKGVLLGPIWFTYVFTFILYFKKNISSIKHKYGKYFLLISIVLYFSMFIIITKFDYLIIRDAQSPLCFFSALCLFVFFKNLNIKENKLINEVASITFSVYLFHTNHFIDRYIWMIPFDVVKLSVNSLAWPLIALLSVLTIFLLTGIIEFLRHQGKKRLRHLRNEMVKT